MVAGRHVERDEGRLITIIFCTATVITVAGPWED
jgi:hypothetical protein